MAWEYWVCGGLYLDTVTLFRRWLVFQVSYFIFLSPRNSQKFTIEEEIILVGSNCFNILKPKNGLLCNPGSEECQCRYERGVVFLSLGGSANTFAALGWCSSLLSSLDIASLVAHQRHSEPITLMEFCQWFTELCSKSFSHCSPWTVSRKYIG